MPNVVNQLLLEDLSRELSSMGSCVVLGFDRLTVAQDEEIRRQLRGAGVRYRVVKNRLAARAFKTIDLDVTSALRGKCGVAIAAEEGAIGVARLVREFTRTLEPKPIEVLGGVIEGQVIVGPEAGRIADMPDRATVRAQLARAILGPASGLATAVSGLAGGLARCLQAKIDKSKES